ncbi:MAG: PAS domain S-box protein [Promethearchaeota archaeon]
MKSLLHDSLLSQYGEIIISTILNEISDLIAVLNEAFIIEYINEGPHFHLLGYSSEDLVGTSILNLFRKKEREKAKRGLTTILERGVYKNAAKVITKEQKIATLEFIGKKFKSNTGEIKIILISNKLDKKSFLSRLSNSTKRLQEFNESLSEIRFWKLLAPEAYSEALEKSYEIFQFILDNIPLQVCWKDLNLVYLGCNKKFAEYLGFEDSLRIIGKTDQELSWNVKNKIQFHDKEQRVIELDQALYHDIQEFEDLVGNKSWFEINRIPLHDHQGKVNAILITHENITDRIKAEKEKQLAEQKLKESEVKYRHLFNHSPDAIWLIDTDGFILDCNETTNKFLSVYKREDLIGKNFKEIITMFLRYGDPRFKELGSIFEKRFQKLIEGEMLNPYEFQVARGDGKEFWLTLESTRVNVGGKNLIQVIIRDITQQKTAELKLKESERQLRILNRELEKKVQERTKKLKQSEKKLREQNIELMKLDKLKNEFINTTSHELKTPLVSIAGFTDYILLKYKDLNPEIREDLEIVKKNVNRLKFLIEQLSDALKIDSKKLKHDIKLKKENMRDIIDNCVSDLKFLMENKNLVMDVNVRENLVLTVDKNRMIQVFINLLSNAIKFTPNDGYITIIAEEQGDYYLFKVKDSGIGLNAEDIPKLFGKFVKLNFNEENYSNGTGLGLYITKGIIETHGGKIWALSEGKDKGAEFCFTLPKNNNV